MSGPAGSGGARQGILSLAVKDKAALYNAYMPYIKYGGIFVPTPRRYFIGDEVFLLLTLPDSSERLPVAGKVCWVTPTGAQGPAFLLFPNHFVIRKYNNATTYALGVGLLADRFGGMGGVIKPWPYESPLAIGDRIVTQRALAQLGFDPGPPDGVVGVNTRNALRSWQKSRGITADGYLSLDMVARLKTEANIL